MRLRIGKYLESPWGVYYRAVIEIKKLFHNREGNPSAPFHQPNQLDPKLTEQYWEHKKTRNADTVVYTCITNGYDDLHEIAAHKYINLDADYVCFTDSITKDAICRLGIWELRPLVFNALDDTRNNRWHKLHPHILFPHYKQSIYLDANVDVNSCWLFDEIRKRNQKFLLPRHPSRVCIYDEFREILSQFMDDPKLILKERSLIKRSGMPRKYGLTENNILYRQHHDPEIISLMDEWWKMIATYSKRDQLSLCWLLWKQGYAIDDISFDNPRFTPERFSVFAHKHATEPPTSPTGSTKPYKA